MSARNDRLLSQRRFFPIFWVEMTALFTDNMFKNALVILVTYKSATVFGRPSSETVPLINALLTIPFVICSGLAGQLASKFEKSSLVRRLKLGDILFFALASIFLVRGHFEILMILAVIKGLQTTFLSPLKYSILPQHLGPSEIIEGNAYISAGTFIAILLGVISGSLLIALPQGEIIVSVTLIFVAIVSFFISRLVPRAESATPELPLNINFVKTTWTALKSARQTPSRLVGVIGVAWFWFVAVAHFSLIPIACRLLFHGEPSLVTLMFATFSIGSAAGSMFCKRISKGKIRLGLVPVGILGISAAGVALAFFSSMSAQSSATQTLEFLLNPSGAAILLSLFLIPFFGGLTIVPLYAVIQTHGESRDTAQVVGASNTLNSVFMVSAAALSAAMIRYELSFPTMFLIIAGANVIAGACMFLVEPRFIREIARLRSEPQSR